MGGRGVAGRWLELGVRDRKGQLVAKLMREWERGKNAADDELLIHPASFPNTSHNSTMANKSLGGFPGLHPRWRPMSAIFRVEGYYYTRYIPVTTSNTRLENEGYVTIEKHGDENVGRARVSK
jgi:hypothetical protein